MKQPGMDCVPSLNIDANVTTEINLARNKIKLKPNDFSEFYILETLNLEYNQMYDVEPEAFKNMTNLRTLDIGVNNFDNIPNLYHVADTLKELSLNDNPIEAVSNNTFFHYSQLKTLELKNCNGMVLRHCLDWFLWKLCHFRTISSVHCTKTSVQDLLR